MWIIDTQIGTFTVFVIFKKVLNILLSITVNLPLLFCNYCKMVSPQASFVHMQSFRKYIRFPKDICRYSYTNNYQVKKITNQVTKLFVSFSCKAKFYNKKYKIDIKNNK